MRAKKYVLSEQEVSTQRWIDIPKEVLDKYAIWRPSPLFRAYALGALKDIESLPKPKHYTKGIIHG